MTPYVLWENGFFLKCTSMDDVLSGDLIYVSAFCLAGLVFAYMGPQPAPLLPNWEPLTWGNAVRDIAIAGDLIKAAKAGDKAAQQQADTKWHQNATQRIWLDVLSISHIAPTGHSTDSPTARRTHSAAFSIVEELASASITAYCARRWPSAFRCGERSR